MLEVAEKWGAAFFIPGMGELDACIDRIFHLLEKMVCIG